MANLKQWILDMAGGEDIEAVVIGRMGSWQDHGSQKIPNYDAIPKGKILTWEEAQGYIDYEFDCGYGSVGCQAIHAWTKNKVISVYQYDGSTCPYFIPRNPSAGLPDMIGG